MDEEQAKPDTIPVPFQGRRVEAVLCRPADFLVLSDWTDLVVQGDYHFKRRHVESILSRGTSATWAVLVDGVMSGFLILYKGSVLHNLYLSPDVRGLGLGGALLAVFRPETIRCKTNMKAGDPTAFYEANGYEVGAADPARPHIVTMTRSHPGAAGDGGMPVNELPAAPASLDEAAELAAEITARRLLQPDTPRPSQAAKAANGRPKAEPRPKADPRPKAAKLSPDEARERRLEQGRARARRQRDRRLAAERQQEQKLPADLFAQPEILSIDQSNGLSMSRERLSRARAPAAERQDCSADEFCTFRD